MSYPSGCTQGDHDKAFDELGPSPEELAAQADADNDFSRDYPTCLFCGGSGDQCLPVDPYDEDLQEVMTYQPCPECNGSGYKK